MEIKYIHYNGDCLEKQVKIHWRYFLMKKWWPGLLIYLVGAVVFILLGTVFRGTGKSIWNLETSLGIGYGIVLLIQAISLNKFRTQWLSYVRSLKQFDEYPVEYSFNEELITIKSPVSYSEMSWKVISGYKLHEDFIFIYLRNFQTTWLWLERKSLSESDSDELIAFLSSHIPPATYKNV